MLRNHHGSVAKYYLRRRGRHFHFDYRAESNRRLLWPASGSKGRPGGPQGDGGDRAGGEGDASEPEAWIVSEWDEELWLDLVALLYRLLVRAGGEPVSLSKLGTQVPKRAREYIDVGGGGDSFQGSDLACLSASPISWRVFFTPRFSST